MLQKVIKYEFEIANAVNKTDQQKLLKNQSLRYFDTENFVIQTISLENFLKTWKFSDLAWFIMQKGLETKIEIKN